MTTKTNIPLQIGSCTDYNSYFALSKKKSVRMYVNQLLDSLTERKMNKLIETKVDLEATIIPKIIIINKFIKGKDISKIIETWIANLTNYDLDAIITNTITEYLSLFAKISPATMTNICKLLANHKIDFAFLNKLKIKISNKHVHMSSMFWQLIQHDMYNILYDVLNTHTSDTMIHVNGEYMMPLFCKHNMTKLLNTPIIDSILDILANKKVDYTSPFPVDVLLNCNLQWKHIRNFTSNTTLFFEYAEWLQRQQIITHNGVDKEVYDDIYNILKLNINSQVFDDDKVTLMLDINLPMSMIRPLILVFNKTSDNVDRLYEYVIRQILLDKTVVDHANFHIISTVILSLTMNMDVLKLCYEHKILTVSAIKKKADALIAKITCDSKSKPKAKKLFQRNWDIIPPKVGRDIRASNCTVLPEDLEVKLSDRDFIPPTASNQIRASEYTLDDDDDELPDLNEPTPNYSDSKHYSHQSDRDGQSYQIDTDTESRQGGLRCGEMQRTYGPMSGLHNFGRLASDNKITDDSLQLPPKSSSLGNFCSIGPINQEDSIIMPKKLVITYNQIDDEITFSIQLYINFGIFDMIQLYVLNKQNVKCLFGPDNVYHLFNETQKNTVHQYMSSMFTTDELFTFIEEYELRYEDFSEKILSDSQFVAEKEEQLLMYIVRNKHEKHESFISFVQLLFNKIIERPGTNYNTRTVRNFYNACLNFCDKHTLQQKFVSKYLYVATYIFPEDIEQHITSTMTIPIRFMLFLFQHFYIHDKLNIHKLKSLLKKLVLSPKSVFDNDCYQLLSSFVSFLDNESLSFINNILLSIKSFTCSQTSIHRTLLACIMSQKYTKELKYPKKQPVIMHVDSNDVVQSLLEIYRQNTDVHIVPWNVRYYESIGIGPGISRDLSVRFIESCIAYKILVKHDNGYYTINMKEDRKTNEHDTLLILQHLIKTVFVDEIPLSIILDPSIILVFANVCKLYEITATLKYKFSILKHVMPDAMCELFDCKKYDVMLDYYQSKVVSDTVMIDGQYYSMSRCCKLSKVSNIQFVIKTKKECVEFVDMKFQFDVWYALHDCWLYVNSLQSMIKTIMTDDVYSKISMGQIYQLMHGKPLTLKYILGVMDVKNGASYQYTTTNCGDEYEVHPEHKRIRKYAFQLNESALQHARNNIAKAFEYLQNTYPEFEKKLIEFWYGTTIMSNASTIVPNITIVDLNEQLLNITPVKAATCYFRLYVPNYSESDEMKDVEELKTFFGKNYDKLKSIDVLTKRIYDSVITGYDLLQKTALFDRT